MVSEALLLGDSTLRLWRKALPKAASTNSSGST
jgi:hypothetical protein